MEPDKTEPEVSPENVKREKILSNIKDIKISLLRLEAAKLGLEQSLIHSQIELELL